MKALRKGKRLDDEDAKSIAGRIYLASALELEILARKLRNDARAADVMAGKARALSRDRLFYMGSAEALRGAIQRAERRAKRLRKAAKEA